MIIYRHADPHAADPPWLTGLGSDDSRTVSRRLVQGGVLVALTLGPVPLPLPAADAGWHDAGDGWQATLIGALDDPPLARRDLCYPVDLVTTAAGVTWACPALIDPAGRELVPRSIERAADGSYVRRVAPALAGIHGIATTLREHLATDDTAARQQAYDALDAGLGVEWAVQLLVAANHIPAPLLTAPGWHALDDVCLHGCLVTVSGLRAAAADAEAEA